MPMPKAPDPSLGINSGVPRRSTRLWRRTSGNSIPARDVPWIAVLEIILRYFLSAAVVTVACGATYLLDLAAPESPNLFLFFGAIVIVAWYLGAGPGWLAVILSTVAVDYFFIPPLYILDLSAKDFPWLVAFIACSVATNALSLKRRRLEAMLLQARDELEQRVHERTLELQHTNDALVAEAAERARAEAALRETQNELARAARIMTVAELTASITHEIKQPLAAVVASGEAALNWLKRSPPALSEADESIGAVIAAAERAADVMSKIRSLMTRAAPALTELDISELVSSVMMLVQASLARRSIFVECHLQPEPPPVVGDRIQLQQLVLNLIHNAVDAMADISDRKRELIVTTRHADDNRVAISVEDCGRGFADADITKCFQPFYSTKLDGMGMGLSICRTIAESHGGTIGARSRLPHGAIFEVNLPAGERHEQH
jgi:C4-dicarboxylate-specific signal transduction histidine kinase